MTPPLLHFWHLTQQMTHSLTNHAYKSAHSFPYSAADSSSLCLLIPAYALLCDCLQSLCNCLTNPTASDSFLLTVPAYSFAYWSAYSLLTHICLPHCLLIAYKAPIVVLPIPASFTNLAYSPPMYISCTGSPAKKSNPPLASKPLTLSLSTS